MSLEIWTADAIILGVVAFMILSWAFEPRTAARAAARRRKPR